jgi:hypothetical protein
MHGSLPQQRHDFLDLPNVVSQPRFHRGCDAQGLVNPTEVIVHDVQRDVVAVVLNLL